MAAAQAAIDTLRDRFGEESVIKGRALRPDVRHRNGPA